MQHVKMLGQPDQFAKVPFRSGAAAAFQIGGVGRACTRLENQIAQFHHDIAVPRTGHDRKGFGRGFQGRIHNLASDEHHFGAVIHACPGGAVKRACLGQ